VRGDWPSSKPATVAAEHGADVSFEWPINDETKIANDVIDGLVSDPEIVRRVSEIERGWPGMHLTSGNIMLSFFRDQSKDVEKQWTEVAYTVIHEIMHRLEHAKFADYATRFFDSPESVTVKEGIPTLMGDIVWAHVMARLPKPGDGGRTNLENWTRIILPGPGDAIPDLHKVRAQALTYRYKAVSEAMRVVSLEPLENLLDALFRGEWWKIAGAVPGSRGSMLAPPGTAAPRPVRRAPAPAPTAPAPPSESSDDDEPPPGAAAPAIRPAPSAVPQPAPPPTGEAERRQIDNWLAASSLERVRVTSDGNSLYNGLIKVAGRRLSRFFARQDLSPLTLRRYIAEILRRDLSWEERDEPSRYGWLIRESVGQTRPEAWQDHIDRVGTKRCRISWRSSSACRSPSSGPALTARRSPTSGRPASTVTSWFCTASNTGSPSRCEAGPRRSRRLGVRNRYSTRSPG
jgi:hypothetical protein